MKKRSIPCIVLMMFILLNTIYAHADILNLSAKSYILIDEISGRVLLEKDAHNKMAMASTTKIMTALLALENSSLEDEVLIDEKSVNIEGSSIYLKNNERISMEDLLYGLMLRSGNDSAVAISNFISNGEDEFVNLMNKKAKELNALNTNFTNPHGLSHENHYSTAYDLALITKAAFKNDIFARIVSSKYYTANRDENDYFLNKNKTLWEYKGGDGVKIGYTLAAERCLVSSAKREDMRLIAVSLQSPNWFQDNYRIMDYGFENFKLYTIYDKNQLFKKIKLDDDIWLNLVAQNDLVYPLKEDEVGKIKVNIIASDNIDLPIEKGDILGNIETYLNGVLIKKDNLIAQSSIKKKSIFQKLHDFIK